MVPLKFELQLKSWAYACDTYDFVIFFFNEIMCLYRLTYACKLQLIHGQGLTTNWFVTSLLQSIRW